MAYFRQCFPSDLNITIIKELAQALAAYPPYQVPISSIKIRHLYCEAGLRHQMIAVGVLAIIIFL